MTVEDNLKFAAAGREPIEPTVAQMDCSRSWNAGRALFQGANDSVSPLLEPCWENHNAC